MRDAIEGMNGHGLDGRNITVNEAQSHGNGGGGSGGGGYSRGGGSKIEEDSLIKPWILFWSFWISDFEPEHFGFHFLFSAPFTSSSFFFFFCFVFFFCFLFSLFLCVASIVVNPIKNMFSYVTYVLA